MIKVKSFTIPLKAFHVMQELGDLDEQVNTYIKEKNIKKVFSVSDTNTTDDRGATIGMIRVLAYQESE
jgi:arginine decarboxylase-like protein